MDKRVKFYTKHADKILGEEFRMNLRYDAWTPKREIMCKAVKWSYNP